jgi:WD40 repeat protein
MTALRSTAPSARMDLGWSVHSSQSRNARACGSGICARNPRMPRRSRCRTPHASTTSSSIRRGLSRDGRWLFVLGTCALWELRSESGVARDRPALRDVGELEIKNAEFSRGGGSLNLYTGEHLLLMNLVSNESPLALDTNQQPVRDAFFTGDDRWVIAECGTSIAEDPVDVRAWPIQHPGEHSSSFVAVSGSRTLRARKTSPRGRWLLASDDDVTRIWELSRDDPRDSERRLIGHRGSVASVCWSLDEQSLFSAGADGRLLRWPLSDTGKDPKPEELHAIGGPLRSVTADWQELRIFAGGVNGEGTLLALSPQLDVTERWGLPGRAGDVIGHFSPTGRWLSAWDDRAVRVFDIQRRVERLELPHDPNKIHLGSTYRYSSDERWLVVSRQGGLFLIICEPIPMHLQSSCTGIGTKSLNSASRATRTGSSASIDR